MLDVNHRSSVRTEDPNSFNDRPVRPEALEG